MSQKGSSGVLTLAQVYRLALAPLPKRCSGTLTRSFQPELSDGKLMPETTRIVSTPSSTKPSARLIWRPSCSLAHMTSKKMDGNASGSGITPHACRPVIGQRTTLGSSLLPSLRGKFSIPEPTPRGGSAPPMPMRSSAGKTSTKAKGTVCALVQCWPTFMCNSSSTWYSSSSKSLADCAWLLKNCCICPSGSRKTKPFMMPRMCTITWFGQLAGMTFLSLMLACMFVIRPATHSMVLGMSS
mmetsp:Transcript_54993/g.146100  ORF Transcript_54993/g.146100 Transcript_54993/m.146100 type:complete len:241 (-) Transcript_54993:1025-1747(-)